MNTDKYILFNPGPVNVTERVRRALLKQDICHREDEFNNLLQNIRQNLLRVYNLNEEVYAAVVLSGSGTAAVESAFTSLVPDNGTVLVVSNGVYGERISSIAKAYGILTNDIKYDWGKRIELETIENAILKDNSITTVAVIHHETTTGILNDIASIGKVVQKYGKELFVDAVSSFAGEEIKFQEWGVDICCGSSNKCIHGIPGVSFVIARKDIFYRQKDLQPRTVYLNLVNYFLQEEKGIPPFTPSVQVLYAFDEALQELLLEGVNTRIKIYKFRANKIRQLAKSIGLKLYLPDHFFSNTLTSFYLPESITYKKLHDTLKENGLVIYAGQGGLYKNIFRIANMGDMSDRDIEKVFALVKQIIQEEK